MKITFTVAAFAAIATAALASAIPTQAPKLGLRDGEPLIPATHVSAGDGALAPTPYASVHATEPPLAPTLTVTVVNKAGVDLTTSHAYNKGASSLVGNGPFNGVLKAGATASWYAPKGWAGMNAYNRAQYTLGGSESLIEGSFVMDGNAGWEVVVINISYVSGFSVPIQCYCKKDGKRMTGCTEPLWAQGTCPAENLTNHGTCYNPMRDRENDKFATPFFEKCKGQAYTFVQDHEALSNGKCQTADIICDILPDGR